MKKALMLVLASLFLASFNLTTPAQEMNADTSPIKKPEKNTSESEEKSEEWNRRRQDKALWVLPLEG